jgi:hypothetical protein
MIKLSSFGFSSRLVWLCVMSKFFYFFSVFFWFVAFAYLEFPCKFLFLWGYSAVSELSPDVLSGGGRCLFCCARHITTAKSTPLISISRNLAPLEELCWKVIAQKCPFQSPASVHLLSPARSGIVDPARSFSIDFNSLEYSGFGRVSGAQANSSSSCY